MSANTDREQGEWDGIRQRIYSIYMLASAESLVARVCPAGLKTRTTLAGCCRPGGLHTIERCLHGAIRKLLVEARFEV